MRISLHGASVSVPFYPRNDFDELCNCLINGSQPQVAIKGVNIDKEFQGKSIFITYLEYFPCTCLDFRLQPFLLGSLLFV